MCVKRAFDLFFSFLGVILFVPLFISIAILIKADSVGEVFFRQERVGQYGKVFRIFKFRTMTVGAEKKGAQVTSGDDPRITDVGTWLRKYKLDELPQLFNILFGDMSLVGPRPEVQKYVELFEEDYKLILEVKPGITDFASLEYRNENDLLKYNDNPEAFYIEQILPDKIKYYHRYLKEKSIATDIILICRTICVLLRR